MTKYLAQLVVKVNGKLKHSKSLHELSVTESQVTFKSKSFSRCFLKPDKAVVGQRILRISQGRRYFLCRFLHPSTLNECVQSLRALAIRVIDIRELVCQENRSAAQLQYCQRFLASDQIHRQSIAVQESLNRALFNR